MSHRSRKQAVASVTVLAALLVTAASTWHTLGVFAEQPGTSKVPGNLWLPKRSGPSITAALTPQEAFDTITVPPGYRVELVAAEPMIDSPILMDFDADGRMWLAEMPGFLPDESGRDSDKPIDRIVVLEDLDDDGKMDKRTVFAEGLSMPKGIKVLKDGILVGESPNVWFMKDVNGDLKADIKEKVVGNYGRGNNVEHDANSLLWAMDNIMYSSEHVWDLRWKGGKFESLPTLNRGQWQITQDDVGRVYRNVNDAPLFVDYTPARYFLRNPNNPRTRGLYELLIEQMDATVFPLRDTRGVNRGYRDELFRPDGSSIVIQGTSGPTIYRGDRYPAEIRGHAFIADSTVNLVHAMQIVDDGNGRLSAKNTFPQGEFFASSDERNRPVHTYSAPDGTLYVIDMYRGVVQAAGLWSDYLTGYIRKNKMLLPVGMGRIWRVVHGTGPNSRGPKPALSKVTPAQLVDTLSHPNGWWRDMAQQLLVQGGDKSVVPALEKVSSGATEARTRIHALWTLDGLDAITPAVVTRALSDASPDVRANAIRLSERWLRMPGHAIAAPVLALAQDRSWSVRRQFAASLGELPVEARVAPAVAVLTRDGNDPIIVDALVSGLSGLESRVLQQVIKQSTTARGPEDGLTILAAAVAKSGIVAEVQSALDLATDAARPGWQRQALMAGLSGGLPPSPMAGRAGGVRTPGLSAPGRDRAQITPGKGVTLAAEPTALTKMAAGAGVESAIAAELAARINWTGKPVVKLPPVAPLTAEETKRFDSGKALYASRCAGCHAPEGQGRDTGPALAGSKWVNAPAAFPIRILAQGKEGPMGLMPPVVKQLNDEQLADVLTYIRRAWNNTGSPITAVEVRETRQSNPRTTVWTEEELTKLLQTAGRGRGGQ